ncbi:MAG: aldehyde dehydrogenase family protein [Pseudomonadales bacterium]
MDIEQALETKCRETLRALHIESLNSGAFDGRDWLTSKEGQSLVSINPATGENLAQVACCDDKSYHAVLANAQAAAEQWRQVPAPVRGELVRKIGIRLRERKAELGRLVAMEMGKIFPEGLGEVQEMIDMADFAVGQSRMMYGKTLHSERPQHRMYEQWQPLGVVAVITAFNFPVAVWAWNAFNALITGNSVVWRPSAKTPLCAIAVQKLCAEVMREENLPPLLSLFIEPGTEYVQRLVADRNVALVSFTGSTDVGRKVAGVVADRMGKSLLELSGNNALIIDATANLDLVIPAIVFGSVGTAGQRCTTTRRLFLHESVYNEVIERLLAAYAQVSIANPLQQGVLMGPLVDEAARQTYLSAIIEAQTQGGKILCGGQPVEGSGFFVTPTIMTAENHWPMVQRETFGPLLYVMKFSQLSDAIKLQNDVTQGLSSALFTNNLQHAEQYLSAVGSDCGIANINIGTSGAEIGGAFGGEKDTGGGREAGSDAWQNYMRRQTNTINWGAELPLAQGIDFKVGSA